MKVRSTTARYLNLSPTIVSHFNRFVKQVNDVEFTAAKQSRIVILVGLMRKLGQRERRETNLLSIANKFTILRNTVMRY